MNKKSTKGKRKKYISLGFCVMRAQFDLIYNRIYRDCVFLFIMKLIYVAATEYFLYIMFALETPTVYLAGITKNQYISKTKKHKDSFDLFLSGIINQWTIPFYNFTFHTGIPSNELPHFIIYKLSLKANICFFFCSILYAMARHSTTHSSLLYIYTQQ